MLIVRVTYVVVFFVMLISCSSVKKNEHEVFYYKKNTKIIDVYNITRGWVSSEDVRYLKRRDYDYGEFGGRIRFCSDENYFCLSGGINIAIPKRIEQQTTWEFYGRVCSAESPLSEDVANIIVCEHGGYEDKFVYLKGRGVVFYWGGARATDEYELIGEKGLFAN